MAAKKKPANKKPAAKKPAAKKQATKKPAATNQEALTPEVIDGEVAPPIGGHGMTLALPATTEGRWEFVLAKLRTAAESIFAAGYGLLALREELPKKTFVAGLEERRIPTSSAYTAMKVASVFGGAADEVKALGSSKLLELAAAGFTEEDFDPDKGTIGDLPIDDIDKLSVRELKSQLRAARKKGVAREKEILKLSKNLAEAEQATRPGERNYKKALEVLKEARIKGCRAVDDVTKLAMNAGDDTIIRDAASTLASMAAVAVLDLQTILNDCRERGLDVSEINAQSLDDFLESIGAKVGAE